MTDYLKSVKCILEHLVLLPARYTQYYHIEELGNTLTLGLNTVGEIYRYIDLGLRVYFQTCRDFFGFQENFMLLNIQTLDILKY